MGAEFPRRRDELDYDGDEKCLLMTGLRKNISYRLLTRAARLLGHTSLKIEDGPLQAVFVLCGSGGDLGGGLL